MTIVTNSDADENPLLEPWTGPFEAPPFDRVVPRHFRPAFDAALGQARAEIDAVAANPEAPTFANTIEALERSGRSLEKVANVFFNLTGAHTSDELQAIEREIAPVLARHRNATYLNEALFRRIDALKAREGGLGLSAEQARVLERYHLDFTRAGAGATAEAKARLAAIAERLATLAAAFGQNVLADEKDWRLLLETSDLDGLPDFFVASAARIAADLGHPEQVRGHPVAIERRAVPAILGPARSPRDRLPRLGGAGRKRRRERQSRHRRRNGAPESRARAPPRLRDLRPLPPRRHDGENAARRARSARIGLDAGRRRRAQGRGGAAGVRGRRGRQFQSRALGLAILGGKAAQGTSSTSTRASSSPICSSTA